MNYTQHYQLPQWVETDRIMMDNFNDMTAKLDTGLAGLAGSKAELVTGTYHGDSAASRAISLGFAPKALYLCSEGGIAGYVEGYYYVYGGLALPGHPVVSQGQNNAVAVELTADGFQLTSDEYRRVNESGLTYHYLALR
mgnify:CR=1 FL=1